MPWRFLKKLQLCLETNVWAWCQKTNLKYSNNSPKERVKVFPVRDGVAALRSETEFTAKQMHPQDTTAKNNNQQSNDQPVIVNPLKVSVC